MEAHEKHTVEQNLHSLAIQKQALQQQLMEVEMALKELDGAKTAYRIVNGLMIEAPVEKLTEELNKKKESSQNRLNTIERQTEKLKAKLEE